jgi:hypothetical protein
LKHEFSEANSPYTNILQIFVTILTSRNKNKNSEFWCLTGTSHSNSDFEMLNVAIFDIEHLEHFNAFLITSMWQVYTRPTSTSDFLVKHIFLGASVAQWLACWYCTTEGPGSNLGTGSIFSERPLERFSNRILSCTKKYATFLWRPFFKESSK